MSNTTEQNAQELKAVKVAASNVVEFNPLSVLNERQRIALAAKWGA